MENFRPPAMDEVNQHQMKRKIIIGVIITFCIAVFSIGGFFGVRQLVVYLNYLSSQERYQTLHNYFQALTQNDTNSITLLAPNNTNYIMPFSGDNYNLHIYPNATQNEDELLFILVDNSSSPLNSYLQKVTYNSSKNPITIETIEPLSDGSQIN